MNLQGNVSQKDLGDWSADHYFYYRNITGDEKPELVFADKNQLTVLTDQGELIFTYDFNAPIHHTPMFFNVNQFTFEIGISSERRKLFLLNDDGTVAKGFPVEGTGSFYVGSIRNDGLRYLLCSRKTNYLSAFKL